jgi:hypothetical protein
MGEPATDQLLTEIRDALARIELQHKQNIADNERLYKEQYAEARRISKRNSPWQWISLFAVVYLAVLFALSSNQ